MSTIWHRSKKKFLPCLFLLLIGMVSLVGSGCDGSSDNDSENSSIRSLEGYWEGILSDGDFDGQLDESPQHYIFLDITSDKNGTISGHFHQQVGDQRSDAPLTGTTDGEAFRFSTNLNGEAISFSGHFSSIVHDYEGEHFIVDWIYPGGHSGTVIFVSVDSHIQPDVPSNKGFATAASSENSLTRDSGSTGQPIIFVHGWNSGPGTWNDMITKFKKDGYFQQYEVWRFGYDSDQHIEDIGAELLKRVSDAGLKGRNPIIVAHSMGGIVARSYIKHGGRFSRFIAISSPHAGTPLGVFGNLINTSGGELAPCSSTLEDIFNFDSRNNFFDKYAVVSGKLTGKWKWVSVRKCGTICTPFGCHTTCADIPVYLWQFDRNYDSQHKAEWVAIKAMGFGDNDGVVPTASANFCVGASDQEFSCHICPPINYENNKHLTNYDHTMPLNPAIAPDVYEFVVKHLN